MGQSLRHDDAAFAPAPSLTFERKLPSLVVLEVEQWAKTRLFAALSLLRGVRVVVYEEPPR